MTTVRFDYGQNSASFVVGSGPFVGSGVVVGSGIFELSDSVVLVVVSRVVQLSGSVNGWVVPLLVVIGSFAVVDSRSVVVPTVGSAVAAGSS